MATAVAARRRLQLPAIAFESWAVPLIGFFLLPWTTLAYALMWDSSNRVYGFEWFIVALGFFFDLASCIQNEKDPPKPPDVK